MGSALNGLGGNACRSPDCVCEAGTTKMPQHEFAAQQFPQVIGGHRAAVQIPLHLVAAYCAQEFALGFSLDPFRDQYVFQVFAQRNDGANDARP